jgi:hypothetical protein
MDDLWRRIEEERAVPAVWVRQHAMVKDWVDDTRPCHSVTDVWKLLLRPDFAKKINEGSWALADYSQMSGPLNQLAHVRAAMLPGAPDDDARIRLVGRLVDHRNELMHLQPINGAARRGVIRDVLNVLDACGAPPIAPAERHAIAQLADHDVDAGVTEAELTAVITTWVTSLRAELQGVGGRIIEGQREQLLSVLGEEGSFTRALQGMLKGYNDGVMAVLHDQHKATQDKLGESLPTKSIRSKIKKKKKLSISHQLSHACLNDPLPLLSPLTHQTFCSKGPLFLSKATRE